MRGVEPEPFLDVDAAWSEDLEPMFAALEADGQRRLTHPELVRHEVVWIRLGS